jgi:DNA invertase Pin-like site-specific DNA recombinase
VRIGYARVSTDEQNLDAQRAALMSAGCERIYEERESGGRWDRPQLQELLRSIRRGDEAIVTRLDRVSRSVRDTLSIIEKLEAAGAGFRSLAENVDTVSPAGRMLTTMLAAFAEFEPASIRARTRDGLAAARKRGVVLGRKPALTPEQREKVRHHVECGDWTRAEAARMFGVDPATITRLMQR